MWEGVTSYTNDMLLLASVAISRSLREAFSEFADCAGGDARARLARSTDFLNGKSEEDVRSLPAHIAKNEQEAVLALQQALLPPGATVRIVGVGNFLDECDVVILSCLRDGSFHCAAHARCESISQDVSVHVSQLRPPLGCAFPWPPSCVGTPNEAAPVQPLTKAAVGRTIALGFQQHTVASAAKGVELGPTAFPDLSYSALAFVLIQLQVSSKDGS